MGQKIEESLDEEEINFIYVNPLCKDKPQRMKALSVLEEKYSAEIIYNDHIDTEVLLMAGEKLSEEELLTVGTDDSEN